MKPNHISMLCDPVTGENLELVDAIYDDGDIVSGKLKSSSNIYKITNGIPRFVENQGYSDNFGYQWNRWARVQFEDENIGRPMQNHTQRMFCSITRFTPEKLKGKVVLDMGCGPGRFTDVASSMGATIIALDYSSAIDAAKDNFSNKEADILFIQGDALRLPIKDNAVDFSFSIGVLHHTPSPFAGVCESHRVTRDGGEFAIRVYEAKGFYTYLMVRFWRQIFMAVKPVAKHYPALFYSYIFGTLGYALGKVWRPLSYPLRAVFPTAWLPDYRWTILDTFDAIATTHQTGHTPDQIRNWLQRAGYANISHEHGNDFVAKK